MKRRGSIKKALLICIGIFVISWLGIFFTDYYRCSHLEKPLFVVPVQTADDGGSGTYQGLGYTVEVELDSFQVISVTMKIFGKVVAASIT